MKDNEVRTITDALEKISLRAEKLEELCKAVIDKAEQEDAAKTVVLSNVMSDQIADLRKELEEANHMALPHGC